MKFDPRILHKYCTLTIEDIWAMTGAKLAGSPGRQHGFIDRGGDILAVAHLDIASYVERWQYRFKITKNNVVYSVALDDRLGAYLICDFLPRLGLNFDVLLTENEETGASTASDFVATKDYNWIFEFDRRGGDVVLYEYEDRDLETLLVHYGFRVGLGSFSDICYLEHLGVKAMNFGTGYYGEHSLSCHANLRITAQQIDRFAAFFRANQDQKLKHEPLSYAYSEYLPYGTPGGKTRRSGGWYGYDYDYDDNWRDGGLSSTKPNVKVFKPHKRSYRNNRRGKGQKDPKPPKKNTHYSQGWWTDSQGKKHYISDYMKSDYDNHNPVVEPDPYDDSIDDLDLLYEQARQEFVRNYSIDTEDLTWDEYCNVLGIDPYRMGSWTRADFHIWNRIKDH
jgi:hypothetical protein